MRYLIGMKIRMLTASLLISLSMPQLAQAQNKIIILQKDGSREEIILDQPTPAAKAPEPVSEKPSAPTQTAEDLLKGEANLNVAPEVKAAIEPKTKQKSKPTIAPKTKPIVKKEVPKAAVKQEVKIPTPKLKPNEQEIFRAKTAKPLIDHIDPRDIPEGTVITRDLAVRAALEVSPAARSFDVFSTTYKDRPVYQVRFKTEGGPHDVIIDGETGKVLRK
jgi:uncharacterized membrane protein YkoI